MKAFLWTVAETPEKFDWNTERDLRNYALQFKSYMSFVSLIFNCLV